VSLVPLESIVSAEIIDFRMRPLAGNVRHRALPTQSHFELLRSRSIVHVGNDHRNGWTIAFATYVP
jgi:hypothetical protein